MTTTNTSLPAFALSTPADSALCDGLALSGTQSLRLAINGQLAGIVGVTTGYLYVSLCFWMDSTVSGGVSLLECGRTTGYGIGYHTDPVGNGNHAICVAINDGNASNAYAARFEPGDLRSPVGDKTLHTLEILYVQSTGYTCYVDGVSVAAAATGGTDSGIGTGSTATQCTLGGTLNLSPLRSRGALNVSSVVGLQSAWPTTSSGTIPAACLKGGFAYARIDGAAGVPAMELPLIDDITCLVDTGNTGVNHPTNGAAVLPTASPTYEPYFRFLLTESLLGNPITNPTDITGSQGGSAPTSTFDLSNPSTTNYACSNITPSESGVSSVLNYVFSETDIPTANFSALTLSAGGTIGVVVEHSNDTTGLDQAGTISFASTEQDLDATFLVDITSAGTGPRTLSRDRLVSRVR